MFRKLVIRNFQIHRRITVNLNSRLVILAGSNDVGKSAVIRCLRWVCLNRPVGEAHISYGTDYCRATLTVDDHKITRKKIRKGSNFYKLDDKSYTAFKRDVPEAIETVLQVSEINFQKQHDSPFWLSDSGNQVSQQLNEIVNLKAMDTALAHAASLVRKESDLHTSARQSARESRKLYKSLAWIPASRETVNSLQSRISRHNRHAIACRKLRNTLVRLTDVSSGRKIASGAILDASAAIADVHLIFPEKTAVRELGVHLSKLQRIPDTLNLDDVLIKMTGLGTMSVSAAESQQVDELEIILQSIRSIEEEICETENELVKATQSLKKLKIKNCPLCKAPLSL